MVEMLIQSGTRKLVGGSGRPMSPKPGTGFPSGSCGYGPRLRPNVGREGSHASKKWIGKLLPTPPSENQFGTARFGSCGWSEYSFTAEQDREAQAHAKGHQDGQVPA